jgi:hypothetical protein
LGWIPKTKTRSGFYDLLIIVGKYMYVYAIFIELKFISRSYIGTCLFGGKLNCIDIVGMLGILDFAVLSWTILIIKIYFCVNEK